MTDESTPDIDRRIRDAFTPDPGAVARVVRGALATAAPVSRRKWQGIAAAAAVSVLAGLLLLWQPWPETGPESGQAVPLSLSGCFAEGILVISLPDGSASIVGGAAREERPREGQGIVLVEGAIQ
jgi:peptidoglycan/LPS O-acetylase OafA/YrhL